MNQQTLPVQIDDTKSIVSKVVEPEQHDTRLLGEQNCLDASSNQASELQVISEKLGRYQLTRLLGRGGMAAVYLARDTLLDRLVAIKIPEFGDHPEHAEESKERFYREARSMATVEHPNLCPIHDVGEFDGRPYLTMGYIEGQTLASEIDGMSVVNTREVVRIVRTLAIALQTAHDHGIVHRDLKPSNVMLRQTNQHATGTKNNSEIPIPSDSATWGEPVIMDFGLASRNREGESDLTRHGMVIGSPCYMAPEQLLAAHDRVGPQTDVYALGVILYQLLCGCRPYEGSIISVMGQITSGIPPKPPSQLIDVEPLLEAICLRAMAHDIDDRYQSAAELAVALEPFSAQCDSQMRLVVKARENNFPAHNKMPDSGWNDAKLVILFMASILAALLISQWPNIDIGQFNARDTSRLFSAPAIPTTPSTGHFVDSGQRLGRASTHTAAMGGLDGDGDVDVMVANYDVVGVNRVWLNDGAAGFSDSGQRLGQSATFDIALADLDGDGDLDLYSANYHQPNRVWLNVTGRPKPAT